MGDYYSDDEALRHQMDQERGFVQTRMQNEQMNAGMSMDEQNRNMIKEQLDITEELIRIENLLRGKFQSIAEDGRLLWNEPLSNDDILLTEAGINLVLNSIQWYINKNTLLSNYDEATILTKMEDFATSLADALFMNYEKYFLYPTEDDCQKRLMEKLQKRAQQRKYTLEVHGQQADEKEIWLTIIKDVDPDLERMKIKEQMIKNKLKGFDLLMREIQDAVHSTYLRALGGQERRTLRQHIHISESWTPQQPTQKKSSGPFGFFKR